MINTHALDEAAAYRKKASEGLLGRDQYARLLEKEEYQTLKWYHQVVSRCIEGGFLGKAVEDPAVKEIVEFNLPPDDFVDLLVSVGDAHYESYQQDWDKSFKKAWCAKKENKNHPDCK